MNEYPAGYGSERTPYQPTQAYAFPSPPQRGAIQVHQQQTPMPYAATPAPVSAGGRLGAVLLDALLMLVTLWIGWLIWSLFTWQNGQTPGKQMLGHVVADAQTGEPFDWARMALREFCIKGVLGWLLNVVSFGIYFWVDSLMVLGDRQQTLHDRMANSIVRHI
ncbi:RDD family protein [Paractinoplanes rishiriensis]|uniref:RDD domain-containing protein n=1 Tax=Paractinoplanes rishiriensis TaxID=1050105 RepID=A0A919JRJ2_9ACTN|nr:RDD family protein [Actinoplanes rishiriensis]GIE93540.1 hypothetical protein Ari01nite_10050 [Actinoplanes rishiriensis]